MAEILQYVHKDGFFHRLTPLTKILFIILIAVICVLATGIPFLLLVVAVLLLLAYISHLHRELLQQLRLVLVMSAIFIVITVLTMPNGAILGTLIPHEVPLIGGAIPVTIGGIAVGIVLALRFIVLIFAFHSSLSQHSPVIWFMRWITCICRSITS